MRKIIFLFSAFFLTAWLGVARADLHVEPNKITSAKLATDAKFSILSLTFSSPGFKFQLEPNMETKTYSLIVPGVGFSGALEYKAFEDARVKTVQFRKGPDESTRVDVVLKDVKTSIFRTLSADGLTLELRLAGTPELMTVKTETLTPEEMKLQEELDIKKSEKSVEMSRLSGKEDFKAASELYRLGKFKSSLAKFSEFIDAYPKSSYLEKAYFLRAESLYMTGRDRKTVGQAIDAYKEAINLYPNSDSVTRARLRLADLYMAGGMDVEAMSAYDAMVKGMPTNKFIVQGLLGRAKVFMGNKLYYEASNELEKILLFYPKSPEVRAAKLNIAEALAQRGKFEEALRIYDQFNKRWPDFLKANKNALYYYGETNMRTNRLDTAMGLFSDLLNIFPESNEGKEALNRMADIYLAKGKLIQAVKLLGIQARTFPETEPGMRARLKLASLGQMTDKQLTKSDDLLNTYPAYFDPLATYNDIIKKHPDEQPVVEAMYQKALLFHKRKAYTDSLDMINAMVKAYEGLGETKAITELSRANLYALVRLFHEQGGEVEALRTYFGNLEPYFHQIKDVETLVALADALRAVGLNSNAIEKYTEALKLPGSAQYAERIIFGTGSSYFELGKYDEAVKELKRFAGPMQKSVYAVQASYTLGRAYEGKLEYQKAVSSYNMTILADRDGAYALAAAYNAGTIYKNHALYSEALKMFTIAIAKYKHQEQYNAYLAEDSYYQLVDCAYRWKKYDKTVKYAEVALAERPNSTKANWAKFVIGDANERMNRDERALEANKVLAKEGPSSPFKKAAVAFVENAEWKSKNPGLFPD